MSQHPTTYRRAAFLLLPYWSPVIPPQGIGMLKAHLVGRGLAVRADDFNTTDVFRELYDQYFALLSEYIPLEKQANLHNIGHDVLHNHMTAADRAQPAELPAVVRTLLWHTFYSEAPDELVTGLIAVVSRFYTELDAHVDALLDTWRPDLVGFSVLKGTVPASMHAAQRIRVRDPEVTIIFGGGTFADSHGLGSPNFDALVDATAGYVDHILVGGQGERLIDAVLDGEVRGQRVVTMESAGKTPIPFDDLPAADLSDFRIERYPYLAATGSASCPLRCSFCNTSVFFGPYKRKRITQLVDEMVGLSRRYGKQVFFLTDSLLNPIVNDLAAAFAEHPETVYYDCYFRVHRAATKLENTFRWRRGGLYRTRIGIESGSQRVLDMMHKRITVQQSKDTLYALATAGVKTTAYMVIGHPGETEEDFQETLDLMTEMKDFIWQAEPNPFYYHYAGQFDSDSWAEHRHLVYPEHMRSALLFDTWTLDLPPLREERYERLQRFTQHCRDLGIPNPYTGQELYAADERWAALHRNAVPGIWEFEDHGARITEAKHVHQQRTVEAGSLNATFQF